MVSPEQHLFGEVTSVSYLMGNFQMLNNHFSGFLTAT
jgi:hypothetical protein